MHVTKIQLSKAAEIASKKIIKSSKKPLTLGEQISMANYYAFLHNPTPADNINYAKILLGN